MSWGDCDLCETKGVMLTRNGEGCLICAACLEQEKQFDETMKRIMSALYGDEKGCGK